MQIHSVTVDGAYGLNLAFLWLLKRITTHSERSRDPLMGQNPPVEKH